MKKDKPIIYQVFPRILTNTVDDCVPDGSLERNGSGKMNHFTPKLLKAIHELGANCIWYTGIIEHATKTSFPGIPSDNANIVKGEAGSPYAIRDYYDIDPALAENISNRMVEFEQLVERTHKSGMKVIIDFVPNHTARIYKSDAAPEYVRDFGADDDNQKPFDKDNNYYYIPGQQFSPDFEFTTDGDPYIELPSKATGNDCFSSHCSKNDWYETVKLNYGHNYNDNSDHFYPIPSTWLKMLDILRFWCNKGVDGFRCDMVFMVPLPFWHWVITEIKKEFPKVIFIGEIYDINLYRPFLDYGGFDYLYDKVNLYDTLVDIERNHASATRLTGCWQTVDGIGDKMVNFLENHDEVRFGSTAYAYDPMRAVASLVVCATISTSPVLIYYGQELGERATDNEGFAGDNNRSTIFDYWSYPTMRRWYNNGKCDGGRSSEKEIKLRETYKKILTLCNKRNEISNGQFFDLMYANKENSEINPDRQFAFLRYNDKHTLLVAVNFDYKKVRCGIFIPEAAFEATGINEMALNTVELLSGKATNISISKVEPLRIDIEAGGAIIIEIK